MYPSLICVCLLVKMIFFFTVNGRKKDAKKEAVTCNKDNDEKQQVVFSLKQLKSEQKKQPISLRQQG